MSSHYRAALVMVGVLLWPALAWAQEGRTVALSEASAPSHVQRGAFIALAASSTSLQVYDTYSTLTALNHGAVEANPLMRGIVKHPGALVALKAGVAMSSVFAATQLWRQHHRNAALVLLAVTNGTMAAVAVHNASVISR